MSRFIIRVELPGKPAADYTAMHRDMRKAKYRRVIKGSSGFGGICPMLNTPALPRIGQRFKSGTRFTKSLLNNIVKHVFLSLNLTHGHLLAFVGLLTPTRNPTIRSFSNKQKGNIMTQFITRVELHGIPLDHELYNKLHVAMEEKKFYRRLIGADQKIYQLPTGTYQSIAELTAPQVRDMAVQIAEAIHRPVSVVTAGGVVGSPATYLPLA